MFGRKHALLEDAKEIVVEGKDKARHAALAFLQVWRRESRHAERANRGLVKAEHKAGQAIAKGWEMAKPGVKKAGAVAARGWRKAQPKILAAGYTAEAGILALVRRAKAAA